MKLTKLQRDALRLARWVVDPNIHAQSPNIGHDNPAWDILNVAAESEDWLFYESDAQVYEERASMLLSEVM